MKPDQFNAYHIDDRLMVEAIRYYRRRGQLERSRQLRRAWLASRAVDRMRRIMWLERMGLTA